MSSVTLAMIVVLALIEILTLALVYLLIRRVNSLAKAQDAGHELPVKPAPGHLVGSFEVSLGAGRSISDRTFSKGEHVVIFLLPGCVACENVVTGIRNGALAGELGTVFIAGNATDPDCEALAGQLSEHLPIVYIEPVGQVTKAFDIIGFPSVVRLDKGVVSASGLDLASIGIAAPVAA
jgi:hypothetical protein